MRSVLATPAAVLALALMVACAGSSVAPDNAAGATAAAAQRSATAALEQARAAQKAAEGRKAELAARADAAELSALAETAIFAGANWDEATSALAAADAALAGRRYAEVSAAGERASAGFDRARQASVDLEGAVAKRVQAQAGRAAWAEQFSTYGVEEPAGDALLAAASEKMTAGRYADAAKAYGDAVAAFERASSSGERMVREKAAALAQELSDLADPWARAARASALSGPWGTRAEVLAVAAATSSWRLVVTSEVARAATLRRADAPDQPPLALGNTGVDFAFVPPGRYILELTDAGGAPAMSMPLDLGRETGSREVVLALEDAPVGMVFVPAASGLRAPAADEPSDFWIDRLEVTQEDFARYLAATGDTAPLGWPLTRMPRTGQARLPAITIALEQAGFYALWAGKRLPWLTEWDKAARGGDGRAFPWGNEPRPGASVTATTSGLPGEVGAREDGASPYGALDMSGNASEYGLLPEGAEPGAARILGGSYPLPPDQARFDAAPRVVEPAAVAIDAGIRCARSSLVDGRGRALTPEAVLALGTSPGAMIEAMRRLSLRGDAAAREELFARTGDANVWVHRAARFYLATSAGDGAGTFLTEHLAADDPNAKRRALLTIVGTPVTRHDALLFGALDALDDAGRVLAYERLARRASEEFAASYLTGLTDPNERNRARCLEALGACFSEDRVAAVAAKLDDPSPLVRHSAGICLMRWGRIEHFERVFQLLLTTPQSENDRRTALINHLPFLGLDQVIANLYALVPQAPQANGVQALQLLGLMGGAQHVDAMVGALHDQSTANAAVVALGFAKTDKACAALLQILPRDNVPAGYRVHAANCLAACRYSAGLPALEALMNKTSLPIEERRAYVTAIGKIGGPEAHAIIGRAIEAQGHPLAGQYDLIAAYARSRHPTAMQNLRRALESSTTADRPIYLGLLAAAGDATVKPEILSTVQAVASWNEPCARMCLLAAPIITPEEVLGWLSSPRVVDQFAGAFTLLDIPELPAPESLFEAFGAMFPGPQERMLASLRQRQAYECADAIHALLARWTDGPAPILLQLRALEGELLRAKYRVQHGGQR